MSTEGEKHDEEKLRYDLVPLLAEEQVVKVLTYGAKKYGPDNWRKVPEARRRYYAAARRHLTRWRLGEELDRESGLPHLAHAICSLLFLLEVEQPALGQPAVTNLIQYCQSCKHRDHMHLSAGCIAPHGQEYGTICGCKGVV